MRLFHVTQRDTRPVPEQGSKWHCGRPFFFRSGHLYKKYFQTLPFLQFLLASQPSPGEQKFGLMMRRDAARQVFRRVPWTFTLTQLLFFALALPLYPLRIEEIPQQLWFALSIVFVLAMFPAKLLIGWGVRRSNRVSRDTHWFLRWLAWIPMMAAIAIYVGFLYLGKFTLWQGGISVLLQHAFLPPVPFYLE